jgi:AcrR family transcriptional regulator
MSTRSRTPLSRERVLRAGVALADEGGIEALSMRKLGQKLGVEAMSLYNHVANKDDLLIGIADLVLSEIELPDGGNWKAALRQSAVSAHHLLHEHPWAPALAMSPPGPLLTQIRRMEWTLRRFREAGFSAELTYHAYHALDAHILGFTVWQLGHSIGTGDLADLVASFLRRFPADEYPYLAEHGQQHIAGFGRGEKGAFELVLDLILDGLEQLRDAS